MADELNFQIPQLGFDSYLYGIIPDDQAVLAGAFSVSMQQIRNINKINVEEFAQVAYNIENMAGLPFAGGTNIPTDLQSAIFAKSKTALGSGVYGTFTTSNFFGCMSGLPYPLQNIYDSIKQLETDNLKSIYQNLYLAVTWDIPAGFVVNYESRPAGMTTEYLLTGVTCAVKGAGYGRGNAPSPSITINNASATVTVNIGTNPDDLSTYGQITGFTVSGATWQSVAPPSFVSIEYPPNTNTGGSNSPYLTSGWPSMNGVISYYVDQANNEIENIKTSSVSNFEAAKILNVCWDITGTALKQEQRARNNFAAPVTVPYDRWFNISPTALYVFVDSIPDLAKKTEPHMAAQTLEQISNLKNVGGQSVVGLMRESRNQERLAQIGIELDNNLSDRLEIQLQKMLLTNGTVPGAVDGIGPGNYTIPANPAVECVTGGSPCDLDVTVEPCVPEPVAFFDPNTQELQQITETKPGSIAPIIENTSLGPFCNGTGPVFLIEGELPPGLPPAQPLCGDPPEPECIPSIDLPVIIVNPLVPSGESPPLDGSNLPPALNTAYTATTLIPSTYNVNDAIDKVIECNCDCWVN
jgi:hypothetical protein